MFTNLFFFKKKMPVYKSSYSTGKKPPKTVSFIRPYILNDNGSPSKTLIGFRIYYVSAEDAEAGKIHKDSCEREAFAALTPDDAYKFNKTVSRLLEEIYNEDNYTK